MPGSRTVFHPGLTGLLLLALGAPLNLARPCFADPPARNVGLVAEATRQQVGFDAAASAGLFVGIRHFEDPAFAEVPYAVDDAVDLAHRFVFGLELMRAPKVVLALAGTPQKAVSRRRLEELKAAGAQVQAAEQDDLYRLLGSQGQAAGPQGLFVVAVASHGFSDQGSDYLVASSSLRRRITRTGVVVQELLDDVARAATKRQLILLDACRERLSSGTRAGGADPASALGRSFAAAIAKVEGQAVLAAATENGYAYDDPQRQNGVFTATLLDGLNGGAQVDEDGLITVALLTDYVQAQVAAWVRRYKPEHAQRSRGITSRIEGEAARLPLAVDVDFVAGAEQFAQRRDAALAQLKGEIGGEITGRMYDDVAGMLTRVSASEAEPWLVRIETLDGTLQAQESFAWFYSKSLPPQSSTSVADPHATQTWKAGDGMTEPALGIEFRYIPAGRFQMGSPPTEPDRDTDEVLHEVTLSQGLWMGATEVTQSQWRRLMGNNPSVFSKCGEECPVERVSWFDAVAFANALSAKAGLQPCYEVSGSNGKEAGKGLEYSSVTRRAGCTGYRLPTEAEWEYAVRAGTLSPFWTGSNLTTDQANYDGNFPYGGNPNGRYREAPVPVKSFAANPWGLFEVHGNVWEWVEDAAEWSFSNFQVVTATYREGMINPLSLKGSDRVIRGGSWLNYSWICRSANRTRLAPNILGVDVGFRLAREP